MSKTWIDELRKNYRYGMLECTPDFIEKFIETQISIAREEGRQEGYAEAGKVIDNISFSL